MADLLTFPERNIGRKRLERSPATLEADANALFAARQIKAAKEANNDWTAQLLLALLTALTPEQRDRAEFLLLGRLESESARQALALVQLANGSNAHRERVVAMLDRIGGGEA